MVRQLVVSLVLSSWIVSMCESAVVDQERGKTVNSTTVSFDQFRKVEDEFLGKLGITKPKHRRVGNKAPPITSYVRSRFQELKGNEEYFRRVKDQSITAGLKMSPTIRLLSPERIHGHGALVFVLKDVNDFGNISRVELVFNKPKNNNIHVIVVSQTEGITSASTDDGYVADVTKIFLNQFPGDRIRVKVRLLPQRSRQHLRSAIRRMSPMLAIFDRVPTDVIQHNHHERQRRSQQFVERTLSDRENASYATAEEHDYCRLVPWELHIRDLGWESFVQEPQSYTANYCTGRCPPPLYESYLNTTNYAFIKNYYHIKKDFTDSVVPRACCTPIEYVDESLMYIEQDRSLTIKRLSNMRVTRCGCR